MSERDARADDEAKGGLPELTKKILSLGLGAYFLTEDAIRRTVKESKIPRDIGKSIAQNAAKGKEELFGFVARELSGFLRQMDLQKELDRFALTHKIRVTAEIEFLPRGEGAPAAAASAPAEHGEPDEPPHDEDQDDELTSSLDSGLGPAVELDVNVVEKPKE
jgi:hypothetical protein